MDAIEIEAMKAQLCRDILNEENDSLIEQMKRYYEKIRSKFSSTKSYPSIGPYSIEEGNERIRMAEERYDRGETVPYEESMAVLREDLAAYEN